MHWSNSHFTSSLTCRVSESAKELAITDSYNKVLFRTMGQHTWAVDALNGGYCLKCLIESKIVDAAGYLSI